VMWGGGEVVACAASLAWEGEGEGWYHWGNPYSVRAEYLL
jgi:hypothetical protein